MASLPRWCISSLTEQKTSYYGQKKTNRDANDPLKKASVVLGLQSAVHKPKATSLLNLVLFLFIIPMSCFINHTLR